MNLTNALPLALGLVIFSLVFPFASHMGGLIRSAFHFRTEMTIILITFVGFGLLGLTDDLVKIFGKGKPGQRLLGLSFGLTRKQKFLLQFVLAFAISYLIYKKLGIQFIHVPFFDKIISLKFLYVPLATFIIVAFTNAYNITDGLDGLATGLLMIFLIAFIVIVAYIVDTPLSVFIAIWLGAIIAFLYFNVWPARIFLGDAGALSFGAMLGLIGLITGRIIALVIIGGVFVIEVVTSAIQMLGWKYLKRPIFPLAPVHHALLEKGWQEPKIVMRAWI